MLGYINGIAEPVEKGLTLITVSFNSGTSLGFLVNCLKEYKDGDVVKLYLYHEIKENIMRLHGFPTILDLTLFENLLKLKGVGCSLAMTIMRQIPREEFIRVVKDKDRVRLTDIKGVGKKTVDLILEKF